MGAKKHIKKLFDLLERPLPYFFTFHLRPKRAKHIGVWSDKSKLQPKCAIVIQGPILYSEDFTLETVRLYKKIFSEAIIIVSTWDYENKAYIGQIKQEGVEVLINKAPEIKGCNNINFQIISSVAGISRAKELGVDYVLKTRTDMRVYGINTLEFLFNVSNQFSAKTIYRQNKRIIGVSLNTFKYRLYGLSDMNLFGQVDDMLNYWNVGLDEDGKGFADLKIGVSELYLSTKFLKKIGREVKWTLEDSWQAFAENFCVVDAESLDLYWYKYARMKEYRYRRYSQMCNDQEMSFKEWFNIYAENGNKSVQMPPNIRQVIP